MRPRLFARVAALAGGVHAAAAGRPDSAMWFLLVLALFEFPALRGTTWSSR
jgi:hypothetical protein